MQLKRGTCVSIYVFAGKQINIFIECIIGNSIFFGNGDQYLLRSRRKSLRKHINMVFIFHVYNLLERKKPQAIYNLRRIKKSFFSTI